MILVPWIVSGCAISACPPCQGGECFISAEVSESDMTCQHGWSSTLNPGGWTVVECRGSVIARAVGVGFYSSMNWECWDPPPQVPSDWVVFPFDAQSGDMLAQTLGASASTGGSPWSGISGSCSVSANAFNANYSKQDQFHDELWKEQFSDVGIKLCVTLAGRLTAFELASGFGNIIRNYKFERTGPGDMSWDRDMTYSLWVTFAHYPFCDDGPGPALPLRMRVDFISYVTTARTSNGSTIQKVAQGVIGVNGDGSTTRLGLFNNPAFNTQFNPNGFSINGSLPVDVTFSDPLITRVTDQVIQDSYRDFDGNVDGDQQGVVCWSDRKLLVTLLGYDIDDPGYRPRADADLSGTITVSDLDALNQIGCSADVDCDGELTDADFALFAEQHQSGHPAADMNGDGQFNADDYSLYQSVFALGCP